MKKLTACLLAGSILPTLGLGAEAVVDAKKLYEGKCASCHNKDGKGNPKMAKMLKTDVSLLDLTDKASLDKPNDELTQIARKGQGKMPAFKGKISEADTMGLVQYIRALAVVKMEKKP